MTVSHRHILILIKLNLFWEEEGFPGNLHNLKKSFCLAIDEFNHSQISYYLYKAINEL